MVKCFGSFNGESSNFHSLPILPFRMRLFSFLFLPTGVDLTLAITLRYKSGIIAQCSTSFEIGPPDEAKIFGTKGSISVRENVAGTVGPLGPCSTSNSSVAVFLVLISLIIPWTIGLRFFRPFLSQFPKKFHAATDMTINGATENFPFPEELRQNGLEKIKRPGFIYQPRRCVTVFRRASLESPRFTHQETLTVAAIMEEVKRQIGLNFDDLYQSK